MSELVRRYKEYYREQTPIAFESLFAAMTEYDFSSYHRDMRRVFSMHQQTKCMGSVKTLRSSGSTLGVSKKYEFGPNFREIRISVEGLLRLSSNKTILLSDVRFGIRESPFMFYEVSRPPQCDFEVSATWWLNSNVESLFKIVSQIYEICGPVNICALPHIWLAITNTSAFQELEAANLNMINALVNTDGVKSFGNVLSFVRDQMVDWPSGCNFYMCERGRAHFIPMFYSHAENSSINLLNIKRNSKNFDDRIFLGLEAQSCDCGRPFVSFQILPHANNVPVNFLGLPADFGKVPLSLWKGIRSLQILQSEEGKLSIFYSSESNEGLDGLVSLVESLGFSKIDLVSDRYFKVGQQKIPLIWRGKGVGIFDFKI